jgi:hypothetical protein
MIKNITVSIFPRWCFTKHTMHGFTVNRYNAVRYDRYVGINYLTVVVYCLTPDRTAQSFEELK